MYVLVFRCVILYFTVMLAMRIMGKRQIGELQPSELVVTIMISEFASMPVQDPDLPMITGVLPIMTMVLLELIVSLITLRSVKARTLFYGKPLIMIYDGRIRQKNMTRARVTIDDVMESVRESGVTDLRDVGYAVLETNGKLSIIEKDNARSGGLPYMLIVDGSVMDRNLRECGFTRIKMDRELQKRGISSPRQVLLMTVNDNGEVFLVKKQ